MIGAHFLWERIAPLQRRFLPLWRLRDDGNRARLQVTPLSDKSMTKLLWRIFSKDKQDMVEGVVALFDASTATRDQMLNAAPGCDQWGIKPLGLVGERENPFVPEAAEEPSHRGGVLLRTRPVLPYRAGSFAPRRTWTGTPKGSGRRKQAPLSRRVRKTRTFLILGEQVMLPMTPSGRPHGYPMTSGKP